MKNEYAILVDVSLDVDAVFAKEHDVQFVSMDYTLGEENRTCAGMESEELLHRFYDGQRGGDFTKTSQINPANYREYFESYAKQGISILYLALSSGLSGTYQSSMLAAAELMEEYPGVVIRPVDSLSATGGMGLMIEMAVQNRTEGMSVTENGDWLDANRQKVNLWFSVDDLMYLRRGGRVSAATAIVGTTLNIKPLLKVDKEGKLVTFDKKRGNKGAQKALVDLYAQAVQNDISNRVYIVHGDCAERAEKTRQMVLERTPDADVHVMMLSPIIGAHTGPGMLAIIHWGTERQ